jgi:large subunit ribosomal protein L17
MRHNKAGRRLGRTTSHRIAMFRNMVTSFLKHGKVTTTDAKAKELRPIAEKMITLGKRGDLHARRQAASYIRDAATVAKLFTEIAPKFADRPGGYTRIIKLGIRPGDAAEIAMIQLVDEPMTKKETKKPAKQAAPKAAAAPIAAPVEEPKVEAETAPAAEQAEAVEAAEVKTKAVEEVEKCEASAD